MEIGHQAHVATIKAWLDQFENLLPIGRSGMFKYNNQDHAMATGLLAARTAIGLNRFDPWRVNIDAEYHRSQIPRCEPAGCTAVRLGHSVQSGGSNMAWDELLEGTVIDPPSLGYSLDRRV